MKAPSHSFVHSLVLLSTLLLLLHLATPALSTLPFNQLGPEENNHTTDPSLASLSSSVPDHHSLEDQSGKKNSSLQDHSQQLHPKNDDQEPITTPLLDQPFPVPTSLGLGIGSNPTIPFITKPSNITADNDNHHHPPDPNNNYNYNTTSVPKLESDVILLNPEPLPKPEPQQETNHTVGTPPTPGHTNGNNPPSEPHHLENPNTTLTHPQPAPSSPHSTPNTTMEPLNNPNPNITTTPSTHTIDQVNSTLVSSPSKLANTSANVVDIGELNSTLVSAPFKYDNKPENHTAEANPVAIGELNSTLVSHPFQFKNPLNNTTPDTNSIHIGDLNSTLISAPFKYEKPSNNSIPDINSVHIGDPNSTLASHPFQFKKPPNNTTDINSVHIGDLNSTLVSSPFQVKKPPNNTNADINSIHVGDFNSTLVSAPFKYDKPNTITPDIYSVHIGDLNSTLVSTPFQVNKPSNHSANVASPVQIGDLNSTLVSSPFRFDKPSSNTSDVAPVHVGELNSTLVSSPLQIKKPSNNSVDVNSIRIGDVNSTLVSNPFKFVSSNSSTPSSLVSIGELNSTLISSPFKFNPSNNSGSTLNDSPPQFNTSTLASSLFDHNNLTIASSPFHVNSSHSPLLGSPADNSNQSSTPSSLPNTTTVRPSDVFTLPVTNNSLSANTTTNSTLPTGTTILNSSSTSATPYHHNDSKPAPAFVPTGSLFTNPRPNDSQGQPKPSNPVETSLPSAQTPPNKATPAPFPSSWPRYIVPSNTPTTPPANSTLISILFTDALNWPWMVTNSNASSQVLVFMPTLIAYTLQISEDQVVTQSLQAYQPANFNSNDEASMLTLWLGYIPSQYVSELQAMIRAPQSRFYTNPNPVLLTLAKTVNPTLSITTYEKKTPASQAGANATNAEDENPPAVNSGQKIAVIASVTTCGAAILAIGLAIAARQSRRRVANGNRREVLSETGSGRMRIGAPMIGTFHRGSDGAPVPVYRPPTEQVSAVPFNGSVGHQNEHLDAYLNNGQNRSPVRYEYGEARTTSIIHDPFQPSNEQRKSWWNRLSLGLAGGSGLNRNDSNGYGPLHWENNPPHNPDSPNDVPHSRLSNVQNPNLLQSSPPRNNRRLPITRGADGLVSGIGRPVMKENSLFF